MVGESLKKYKKNHDFLVCIDSDGCAFDTMEIKHKECFCPVTVRKWGLQMLSSYVRDAWEYANLYSKTRGVNRYATLVQTIELVGRRKEVQDYPDILPDMSSLKKFLAENPSPNLTTLAECDDPVLKKTYEWSVEINAEVAKTVHNIPPFPFVRESLEKLSEKADIVVMSATAKDALMREWTENDIAKYTNFICSQEEGNKKECINEIKKYYSQSRVLMIGDAPGDAKAASENGVGFYPIVPRKEIASWKKFYADVIDIFLEDKYTPDVQNKYTASFDSSLLDKPNWEEI